MGLGRFESERWWVYQQQIILMLKVICPVLEGMIYAALLLLFGYFHRDGWLVYR